MSDFQVNVTDVRAFSGRLTDLDEQVGSAQAYREQYASANSTSQGLLGGVQSTITKPTDEIRQSHAAIQSLLRQCSQVLTHEAAYYQETDHAEAARYDSTLGPR